MKSNRDNGLSFSVIISLIISARLERISDFLPNQPQGRCEFQDLMDMWRYFSCILRKILVQNCTEVKNYMQLIFSKF